MMSNVPIYGVYDFEENKSLLSVNNTTAVLALIKHDDKYLLINHPKRGWDIPGGHIEIGETPGEALKREVLEETGCSVTDMHPEALISCTTPENITYMIVYVARIKDFNGDHTRTNEVLEVKLMEEKDFFSAYKNGNRELLTQLIDKHIEYWGKI